ncbi:MAG: hypothetical protein WC851_01240 [Candidatus Shapirobacteria bacterium]|jgi:hypothetical protein
MSKKLSEIRLSLRQVILVAAVFAAAFGINWLGHHLFVIFETKTADTYAYSTFVTPLEEQGQLAHSTSRDIYWEQEDWWYSFTLGYVCDNNEWHILADVDVEHYDPKYYDSDQSTMEIDVEFDKIVDDLYYYLPGN